MCQDIEGIPAYVYSVLWLNKMYGRLRRNFSDLHVKIALYFTDFPPAFLIKIDKGDFEIEILENVKDTKDLDGVECDGYIAAPIQVFYGGASSIMEGIKNNVVHIKNQNILLLLGQLLEV